MAAHSVEEYADRLIAIFPVVMRELTKKQTDDLCKGKISIPQFLILDLLGRNPRCKMKDLARFMRVSTAAMTGLVNRLVRSGYAVRKSDSHDRRIVYVACATKGTELVKKIIAQRRALIIKVFGSLSVAEREEYLKILTRIRDIVLRDQEEEQCPHEA
jgi:DNA-binding MarR family transcriptional regulator